MYYIHATFFVVRESVLILSCDIILYLQIPKLKVYVERFSHFTCFTSYLLLVEAYIDCHEAIINQTSMAQD